MGICVSNEPQQIEIRNRAKNCSLLYRPIDTSPYINTKPGHTLSGRSTHFAAPGVLNGPDSLDEFNITKATRDILKLDFIDEHVWKASNPYCGLFQTDTQGKHMTDELINYELKSLRVQMAKSQAIISALTNPPPNEIDDDWYWSPDNVNHQNSSQHCQKSVKSSLKNHVLPSPTLESVNSSVAADKHQIGLPYFLLPHSQTQSFDQCPDQVHPPDGCPNPSRVNRSRSCPDITLIFQRLASTGVKSRFECMKDSQEWLKDSSRKRSCSYLAAIQQGNVTSTESPTIEEEIPKDCSRKLSTLPEDDRESVSKLEPSPTAIGGWKGELSLPPPYRCPPSPGSDQATSTTKAEVEIEKVEATCLNNENPNSDPSIAINTNSMQQHQTRPKTQTGASEIAFQRRAGFSFRRRPGQTGTFTPTGVNQPPTIRRSSAIELVDDSSPVAEIRPAIKQKASGVGQGHQQQQSSTTHGHLQLSVEMETSETESAKGSMESEYDLPAGAATGGNLGIQLSVSPEDVNGKNEEHDQLTEQLVKLNASRPGLLRLDKLSDEEIENHFQQLYLAFNNSKVTIKKRLEVHQRQRDLAETNVSKELEQLKNMMKSAVAISQTGSNWQKKQMATSLQHQLDVLQEVVHRLSSRAEVYGATEQEEKMCKAAEIMVQYVCNTKKRETKLQKELDETKRVMDRAAALGLGNHAKAILSHRDSSGGSMTLPNLGRRRASLCVVPRISGGSGAAASVPLACTCRQTMEEGDQLLKTKLRCPLHCGSNKRRSVSVFTPPNMNQSNHENSRSNSPSSISMIHEEVTINETPKETQQNVQPKSENSTERLWTPVVDANDEHQLQTMVINENVEDNCDDSESCVEDDFIAHTEDLPLDYNSSDDGHDDSTSNNDLVKCPSKCVGNAWTELLSLAKSLRTKKRSESFHDVVVWCKRSTETIKLIRYVISGFLVTMAIGFVIFSFIQPIYIND